MSPPKYKDLWSTEEGPSNSPGCYIRNAYSENQKTQFAGDLN